MKTLEPIIFLLAIIFGCTCKTFSANDLVLTDAKFQSYDLTYQRMPLSQGQGLTFKAYCSNVGSFDHTGVYVNLKIINSFNDTIYDNNSATISVLNSSTDSVDINTPFNASDPGRYTFLYTMYQDSIDDNPSNNIVSIKQDIMEHLFQRDDGNYTGNNSWMGSSSYSEIGNLYEFLSPCIITSASVVIDANTDSETRANFLELKDAKKTCRILDAAKNEWYRFENDYFVIRSTCSYPVVKIKFDCLSEEIRELIKEKTRIGDVNISEFQIMDDLAPEINVP